MEEALQALVERARAARPELPSALRAVLDDVAVEADDAAYARRILSSDATHEVMLAAWTPGRWAAPHDHGGAAGWVHVLSGTLRERRHRLDADGLTTVDERVHPEGSWVRIARDAIHSACADAPCRTLHLYTPGVARMRIYDSERGEVALVDGAHRATLPIEPARLLRTTPLSAPARPLVLVLHTTHYRDGNAEIARASRTLAEHLRAEIPGSDVELRPVRTKADFVRTLTDLADAGRAIRALHFVGHSGMYGIMFGSVDWPEQLSPHEWRALRIPFTDDAEAHFHACRTARWFAPFFARTFGVRTHGHWLYTSFSRSPTRFVPELPFHRARPLHVIACPGRKSHGLAGSVRKYLAARAAPMSAFEPAPADEGAAYDDVAARYAATFDDIGVRRTELRWLTAAIGHAPGARVLDIGCGNGALLAHLSGSIGEGVGVDVSPAMIAHARRRAPHPRFEHLRFEHVRGPALPLADASVDLAISFLSFRYLDWDPILREIARVLVPSGRLLVVDLVEKPLGLRDAPRLLRSSVDHAATRVTNRAFVRRLRALSAMPEWRRMLATNPIRAEHEYRWFFESRFPGRRLEVLSVSRTKRVVAFDSGPIGRALPLAPLTYP